MTERLGMLSQRIMSIRGHQDAYLSNDAMNATSKTMSLAAVILGFDIVELWSEDTDNNLFCTYVHASDEVVSQYPNIIVGHYPNHKREHKLSPKV